MFQSKESGSKEDFSIMKKFLNKKNQKGMTLVEIMVVVAIIGSIMALVTVNVMAMLAKSKVENAKVQMKNLEQILDQYKLETNSFPSSDQGLDALVSKPSTGKIPEKYPPDGFMKKVPKDAWGNDFEYVAPGPNGREYEITSFGADGKEGGEKYDADLKLSEID